MTVVNIVTPAAPPTTADRESLFWASIKDGTDPAGFESYLKQYPDGVFAPLARQRLAGLAGKPPRALDAARFDGAWNVNVVCPPHEAAAGYAIRMDAVVKDGVLEGQWGR